MSRFAPPGSTVRVESPSDVCGDGRGVPELGPRVSTCSPTSGLSRPAAPSRDGRSGRAGAVPGARGRPRAGACPAGTRDTVGKGARRCSGTWNPHKCFPNVFAEVQLRGSCREGCPAQLPQMGLPPLSSPRGRGTCSHLALPGKFGKSGERLPDGPCVRASCASSSSGPARAARLGSCSQAHRREAEPPNCGSGWKGAGGACSRSGGKERRQSLHTGPGPGLPRTGF